MPIVCAIDSAMGKQTPIDRAIEHFGSQAKWARAIGVKQPSIAGAKLRGKVSPKVAKATHFASRGTIPMWKLRPDVFRRPPR